jgi:hypothetical protein
VGGKVRETHQWQRQGAGNWLGIKLLKIFIVRASFLGLLHLLFDKLTSFALSLSAVIQKSY